MLRLHPQIAPVKAAILPLIGKDDGMVEKARALYEELRRQLHASSTTTAAQIGRRYRRQDEIGTPCAFTIDEQTLEDDTVTVRDRDSLAQERLPIGGARAEGRRAARAPLELAEARPSAAARSSRRSPGAKPSFSYSPCASAVCRIQRRAAYGPSSTVKRTSSTPRPRPRCSGST